MLVKATITHLATLETFPVLWNPTSYRLSRSLQFAAPRVLGGGPGTIQAAAGGEERFATRLFLDATEAEGAGRDLRAAVERLERWGEVEEGSGLPPRLLFSWGPFRFRGVIEGLEEEWVRFDPDGNPVRGWVDLSMRK
jgi:contractile injection system tube protein